MMFRLPFRIALPAIAFLLSCGFSAPVSAQTADPLKELGDFRGKFQSQLAEINRKAAEQYAGLHTQVLQSLDNMLQTQTDRGNLSYALAIKDTRDALRDHGRMPAQEPDEKDMAVLKRLRDAYESEATKFETEKATRTMAMVNQYRQGLERRELALTRAGKIDEAVAYKKEREGSKLQPVEDWIILPTTPETTQRTPTTVGGSETQTSSANVTAPAQWELLSETLRAGTKLYIPFGKGKNSIANASKTSCSISAENVTISNQGLTGTCGSFSGRSYIRVKWGDDYNFSEKSFAFSCWIKPDGSRGDQMQGVIVRPSSSWSSSPNRVGLFAGSSKVAFGFPGTALDSRANLKAGSWHHVAVCWDARRRNRTIWVNGIRAAQRGSRAPTGLDKEELMIGTSSRYDSVGFTGLIDEIILHERAINDVDAKQLYEAHKP